MIVIKTILVALEILICLMLIGLVLLQRTKGEGLGAAFGGGSGETLFGSRSGNVLTKATIVLGCAFLINTLVLGMMFSGSAEGLGAESSLMDGVSDELPVDTGDGVGTVAPEAPPAALPSVGDDAVEVDAAEPIDDEQR